MVVGKNQIDVGAVYRTKCIFEIKQCQEQRLLLNQGIMNNTPD